MPVAKLLRVLVNAGCARGRKRLSRVGALLLISGILFVGLRQAYRELSQQNEVGGDGMQLQMNGDAPANGELMKKVGMFKSVACLLHSNQTTRCN